MMALWTTSLIAWPSGPASKKADAAKQLLVDQLLPLIRGPYWTLLSKGGRMSKTYYHPSCNDPVWLEEGFRINESVFCETFISTHKIVFCNGFFTEDGRVTDEMPQ